MMSSPIVDEAVSINAMLGCANRVVIKIGTDLVFDEQTGKLRTAFLAVLARDIAQLRAEDKEVILVTSGAIALGRMVSGEMRPKSELSLADKQALASEGQPVLMQALTDVLKPHNIQTGQYLLTRENFKKGFLARLFVACGEEVAARLSQNQDNPRDNLVRAMEATLARGAVPIINENDAVATAEIKFGDNDQLGAEVAKAMGAQLYFILTNVGGLYTGNPQSDPTAQHIPVVEKVTPKITAMAGAAGSANSTGGMQTKVLAVKIAGSGGCATIIAKGNVVDCRERSGWAHIAAMLFRGGAADDGCLVPPIAALRQGEQHTIFLPNAPQPVWPNLLRSAVTVVRALAH